ncbi:MAG: hypothetical protein ACO22T_05245, partial [Burkholderiales bacterium]
YVGYAHEFVKDATINNAAAAGRPFLRLAAYVAVRGAGGTRAKINARIKEPNPCPNPHSWCARSPFSAPASWARRLPPT